MNQTNLSTLSHEVLVARQEVMLGMANSMMWMAKHYQSLGIVEGMKSCAQRGAECVKEYQRVTNYLNQDKTGLIEMAA